MRALYEVNLFIFLYLKGNSVKELGISLPMIGRPIRTLISFSVMDIDPISKMKELQDLEHNFKEPASNPG